MLVQAVVSGASIVKHEVRDGGDSRQLVRSYDGPGMLTSLRTLARAMLSLTDANGAQAGAPINANDDRRQWGLLARNIHRERSRRANYLPARSEERRVGKECA